MSFNSNFKVHGGRRCNHFYVRTPRRNVGNCKQNYYVSTMLAACTVLERRALTGELSLSHASPSTYRR